MRKVLLVLAVVAITAGAVPLAAQEEPDPLIPAVGNRHHREAMVMGPTKPGPVIPEPPRELPPIQLPDAGKISERAGGGLHYESQGGTSSSGEMTAAVPSASRSSGGAILSRDQTARRHLKRLIRDLH